VWITLVGKSSMNYTYDVKKQTVLTIHFLDKFTLSVVRKTHQNKINYNFISLSQIDNKKEPKIYVW